MSSAAQQHRKFPVHVGTVNLVFDELVVSAGRILEEAGAKPADEFVLEAIDRPGGKVVAEFSATDSVNLADVDRKFFRAVPRGGGRA